MRAVPPGSRRVRSQRDAFRAGLGCPALAGVRADFRASLEAWWRIHVLRMSWGRVGDPPRGVTSRLSRDTVRREAMTGRPGRDTGEARPMSVSVARRCRRWWAGRGYLGTVREGTTPELERRRRGMLPGAVPSGNQTPVYVLCVPRSARRPSRRPRTRPREIVETRNGSPSCSRSEQMLPARDTQSGPRPAALRAWPLRGVSDGWWVHLTRPFTASGWNSGDLLWAIDHERGGQSHRERLANVRHPVGWLRWRLAAWLGPDGSPVPSPRQAAAARAEAARTEMARHRAARAAAAAARSADPGGQAAAARAMLARSSPAARRRMERDRILRAVPGHVREAGRAGHAR